MLRLTKLFFRVFVFLIPTQLAYHFWPEWALVFGIRVDYLSPTVYLTDILLLLLLTASWVLTGPKIKPGKRFLLWTLGALSLAVVNILAAASPQAALFKWLKIFGLSALALLVAKTKFLDFKEDFLKPLLLSSALFSLIGVAQFAKGATLGGLLYFLGERSFSLQTPGISLVELFGRSHLLPYSTFSHPNSLAGYLAVVLSLYFFRKDAFSNRKPLFSQTVDTIYVLVVGATLVLTFSYAAWLALILTCLVWLLPKSAKAALVLAVLFSFALVIPNPESPGLPESLAKRIELARVSLEMTRTNPLFGVGANNFVINLPEFSADPKIAWFLQPAHNLYLLTLAEAGILGLGLFLIILKKVISLLIRQRNLGLLFPILFIVFVGTMDHYFLTLQQNLLLFFLVLGYSLRR